jgi:hypothetical protein
MLAALFGHGPAVAELLVLGAQPACVDEVCVIACTLG